MWWGGRRGGRRGEGMGRGGTRGRGGVVFEFERTLLWELVFCFVSAF